MEREPEFESRPPRGLYEVYDQLTWGDMASLEGAEEQYHVEKVPWVAHFYLRLALHSVTLKPGERGTLLRIREGAAEPPDKR